MLDNFKEFLKKEHYQIKNKELQDILDNTLEHKAFIIRDTLLYLTKNADKFIKLDSEPASQPVDYDPEEDPLLNDKTYTAIFQSLLEENYTPPTNTTEIQTHLFCLSIFYDYVLVTLNEDYFNDTNPISQYALLIRLDVAFSHLLQAVALSSGIIQDKVFHSERLSDAQKGMNRRRRQRQLAILDIVKAFPNFKKMGKNQKIDTVHRKLPLQKNSTRKILGKTQIREYLIELKLY